MAQDLATERRHLTKADLDIADGEERVAAQVLLVERLRRAESETGEAEKLLLNFQQTLEAWKMHRVLILREITRLEALPSS